MLDWFSSRALLESYEAFILDAYGVFWSGAYVLPAAKDFMKEVVKAGKPLVILSNATQRAHEERVKYESFGLIQGVHYHELLTSGEMTRTLAQTQQKPFEKGWSRYVAWWPVHPKFGSPHHSIFEGAFCQVDQLDQADFIYLNTPYSEGRDQTDPAVFESQLEAITQSKLPVICPNPDDYAQHGDPPVFVVRQGAIAKKLEKEGVDVRYIGKPHKQAFDFACKAIGLLRPLAQRIVMVGDNPKTDILGAKEAGLASALLVDTGVLSYLYPGTSLKELEKTLSENEKPTHFLKCINFD